MCARARGVAAKWTFACDVTYELRGGGGGNVKNGITSLFLLRNKLSHVYFLLWSSVRDLYAAEVANETRDTSGNF